MRVSRIALSLGLTALTATAFAMPQMGNDFKAAYKVKAGSALDKAHCSLCHVGMSPKMNPYGADLKKVLDAGKTKKVTPEILKKIEAQDSDKDGVKNGDEIKKGTLPGDAKSK